MFISSLPSFKPSRKPLLHPCLPLSLLTSRVSQHSHPHLPPFLSPQPFKSPKIPPTLRPLFKVVLKLSPTSYHLSPILSLPQLLCKPVVLGIGGCRLYVFFSLRISFHMVCSSALWSVLAYSFPPPQLKSPPFNVPTPCLPPSFSLIVHIFSNETHLFSHATLGPPPMPPRFQTHSSPLRRYTFKNQHYCDEERKKWKRKLGWGGGGLREFFFGGGFESLVVLRGGNGEGEGERGLV